MPVTTKIDLSQEIRDWQDAEYGEDVRSAQVSALQKTQTRVNAAIDNVNQAAADVQGAAADAAKVTRDAAATVTRANATVDHADEILRDVSGRAVAAANSAALSQRWAEGGSGSSKYYAEQSEASAGHAAQSADLAAAYASIVPPKFHVDFDTMELIQDSAATGVIFSMDDNKVLSFEYTV